MWQNILDGGIMMIPLGICSIFVLTIILDRFYSLRTNKIIKPESLTMISNIKDLSGIDFLHKISIKNKDSFSKIVQAALEARAMETEDVKEAIEDQGRQEVARLEKGLTILDTIAGIAPLMGLLGTVLGMIEVFDVITMEGMARTESLSGGISQALITTVAGLSIGIVSLVFYNIFSNKTENLVLEMEKHSSHLVKTIKTF